MQTQTKTRKLKKHVSKSRRACSHILKRKESQTYRVSSTSNNRIKRDKSSTLELSLDYVKNPIDVAKQQNTHPIYGEASSMKFLEQLYQCLKYNDTWCDNHNWSKDTPRAEVIKTLTSDLINLLPQRLNVKYDQDKSKIYYTDHSNYDGCQIPVSCFLPQLKEFNPSLYKLVATTISHLSTTCGFSLWDGEIEQEAVEYMESLLEDTSYHELDKKQIRSLKKELKRWNKKIFPYAKEIRSLSRSTSIETIIDEVNNFDWPDTFTAKRVYLWFHQAFQLILSDFHINSYTEFDCDDYDEGPPLLPEDTFKFTWPSTLDESINGHISTQIAENLNERWGNFGVVPLTIKYDFTKGWASLKAPFEPFEKLCDSTISLWLEPELRDFFSLKPVETKKVIKEERYHSPKKYFKPISWKPKQCTL